MQLNSVKMLCFFGLASVTTLVSAHHGWSLYGNEEFTLTAVVVEEAFGNPHDRLIVEADGKEWNLVLSPPNRSEGAGFTKDNVKEGDTVTAYGRRHIDDDTLEIKTERLEVGDKLYTLYSERS